MFTLNLYQFSKKKNSTAQPSTGAWSVNVTANEGLDVLAPAFALNMASAGPPAQGSMDANPTAYNYAYCSEFGRYYFVRWTCGDGLWYAHCTVDVMATYKAAIGAWSGYVLRAAAASNGYITDGYYQPTTDYTVYPVVGTSPWSADFTSGTYVMTISGKGGTQFLAIPSSVLTQHVLPAMFDDDYYDSVLTSLAISLYPEAKIAIDPLNYVQNLRYFPVAIPAGSLQANQFSLGTGVVSWTTADYISFLMGTERRVILTSISLSLPADSRIATYGAWVRGAPASAYELYFPPFGLVALDASEMVGVSSISCAIRIDCVSGQGLLQVFSSKGALLASVFAQIGIDIPISHVQSPGYGVGSLQPIASGMVQAAVGIAGLATSAGAGLASAIGAANNLLSGAGTASQEMIKARTPHVSSVPGVSSIVGFTGNPTLFCYQYALTASDNAQHGKPLCEVRQLSTLGGFQLIHNPDVAISGTIQEQDQVNATLAAGYFYE